MGNKAKKLHLAIGDLADIESQDADGNTTGNFGDPATARALGMAICNVQHEVWDQAVVTFEQDDVVYEVYVTPVFSEDVNGLKGCFEVKLEYTTPNPLTTRTEVVSYDYAVSGSVDSKLFYGWSWRDQSWRNKYLRDGRTLRKG